MSLSSSQLDPTLHLENASKSYSRLQQRPICFIGGVDANMNRSQRK